MKKNVIFIVTALLLFSCADNTYNKKSKSETSDYKTEKLLNLFVVDIPQSLNKENKYTREGYREVWTNNADKFLTIEKVRDINEFRCRIKEGKELYSDYTISTIIDSDSVYSMKFAKGLFMGKSSFVLRKVDGLFLIMVTYSGIGTNVEITKKIANSIKLNIIEPDTTESEKPMYSNDYFSVEYPKDWKYLEKPDPMHDVYIGSDKEQYGIIIARFETEATLNEINTEACNNQKSLGLSVNSKKTQITGKTAYKVVSKGEIAGMQIKFVEYQFKDGNMFYDLKFGGDEKIVDKYDKETQDIISSFKLK